MGDLNKLKWMRESIDALELAALSGLIDIFKEAAEEYICEALGMDITLAAITGSLMTLTITVARQRAEYEVALKYIEKTESAYADVIASQAASKELFEWLLRKIKS